MKNMIIEYENLYKVNKKLFKNYRNSFINFFKNGHYILGNNVKNFENKFAEYCGTKYCIGVASGLDALTISINAFNFKNGDEIIVPSNTYIASILAIINNGLKPILVEPNIKTYNIDPAKIEEKITKKTKAILVVHLYGKACSMDPILSLSKQYKLRIIEDVAQAHGATYKNKKCGSFGDVGAFSFYPTKNLGALGDAGAIVTDNENLAKKLKALRNYGSLKKYYNDYIGFNSRLDELQACFLLQKLNILDDINEHKRELAKIYLDNLNDNFIKPFVDKDYFDVYHIFNIRHIKRDKLKKYLLENQVITEIHYPIPPHKQKALKKIIKGEYPISEEIHSTTLSLPISFFHNKNDIYKVVDVLNKFKN